MKTSFGIALTGFILLSGYAVCAHASGVPEAVESSPSAPAKSPREEFDKFLEAMTEGDLPAIENHLEKYPADIHRRALATAVCSGNIEVVKLLLQYGADPRRTYGGGAGYSSPLTDAISLCGMLEDVGENGGGEEENAVGEVNEIFKLLFDSIESGDGCIDVYPALTSALLTRGERAYAVYMLENNACVSSTYSGGGSAFSEMFYPEAVRRTWR